ncbi:MAG: hypothetical protein PHH54_00890 [Candidatus Nanoarchaeia archaeon]|nr:hypothetical protein [Candidatus Nanoarchaeia archaeon]MDD5740519.1 hypothetical protein [Candidatus Nanoarchaeia archaeon]
MVKQTPDSDLEKILDITTSNMEILIGEGNQDEIKQRFVDYFKSSNDWTDNNQYWTERRDSAPATEKDEEDYPVEKGVTYTRDMLSVIANQTHFKNKKGLIGVSIDKNKNKFGNEEDMLLISAFMMRGIIL